MSLLTLKSLSVTRAGQSVLKDVSLQVAPGEFIALIGPNGAGKTTLLRAVLGLVATQGHSSLHELSNTARARACAYLPQGREIAWPMSVSEVVALGRLPWRGAGLAAGADQAAIAAALTRLGLDTLQNRPITTLSGGELARALLARALAQQSPLLLADEPIAGLDPAAQISALAHFARCAQDGGAVIASLHDLGLAARTATRMLVLHNGQIVADGPPKAVLTPKLLAQVFSLRAWLEDSPEGLIFQPLERL